MWKLIKLDVLKPVNYSCQQVLKDISLHNSLRKDKFIRICDKEVNNCLHKNEEKKCFLILTLQDSKTGSQVLQVELASF